MNRRDALKSGVGSLIAGSILAQEEASAQRGGTNDTTHWTAESDVIWMTPGKDASGSLPMGNGEVGINLWVEEGGDLFFVISRSDTFSEVGRLLKVGGIRVSLTPNPFAAGQPFRQHLRLRDGVCEITAGESGNRVVLTVFVDAEQPALCRKC